MDLSSDIIIGEWVIESKGVQNEVFTGVKTIIFIFELQKKQKEKQKLTCTFDYVGIVFSSALNFNKSFGLKMKDFLVLVVKFHFLLIFINFYVID